MSSTVGPFSILHADARLCDEGAEEAKTTKHRALSCGWVDVIRVETIRAEQRVPLEALEVRPERVVRVECRSKVRTTLSFLRAGRHHRARAGRSGRRPDRHTLMRRNVGEKGNVIDAGPAVIAAGPSIIERTTSVVSSTVVQGADTLRDKVIGAGVDGAVGEVRDRVNERRATGDSVSQQPADGEMPSPPSSSPS